jgi:hypothetical protein
MSQNDTYAGDAMAAFMGLVFMGVGGLIMFAAADWIYIDPKSLHAPRWVLGAVGFMFFLAGLMVIAQGIAGPGAEQVPLFQWLQFILVFGMMAAFAVVFTWVGLGPGEREFQGSTSIGPISIIGNTNQFIGRCMFGGFGVLTGIGTLVYAFNRVVRLFGIKSD